MFPVYLPNNEHFWALHQMNMRVLGTLSVTLLVIAVFQGAMAQDQPALVQVDEVRIEPLDQTRPVLGRSVLFLNNIAAAYAADGRHCDAIREWKTAMEIQPTNERVRRSLADITATADSLGVVCP